MSNYHPSGAIPVPVDDIAELRLGLTIIPVNGLSRKTSVPGLISRDLTTIRVDKSVFERNLLLYRTTVAHEMAHSVLHQEFYSQFSYSDEEGWLRLVQSIDEKDLHYLEWQACAFASLVCVPKSNLRTAVSAAIQHATQASKKFDLSAVSPKALKDHISQFLTRTFEVQASVIAWRIEMDGLLPPSQFGTNHNNVVC